MPRSDMPHCPICDSVASWPLPFFDRESRRVVMPTEGYHWRVCTHCGSGYPSVEQSLDTLQRYWNMNRIEGVADEGAEAVWERRLYDARYWADKSWYFLAPYLPAVPGRFLDIACGLGVTVKKFKDMGWASQGIDADPNVRVFHERLGVDCVIGQFESVAADGAFDVVSIAHAIYFVTKPREFLLRVRESLRPGGLFLVVNSDLASPVADNNPSQVHTWYPTRTSMLYALRLAGFEVLDTEKHRGSILIAARCSAAKGKARRNLADLFALRFHRIIYRLIGQPLICTAQTLKRFFRR